MHACNGTYKHGFLSETCEPQMGHLFIYVEGISVVRRGLSSRAGPKVGVYLHLGRHELDKHFVHHWESTEQPQGDLRNRLVQELGSRKA